MKEIFLLRHGNTGQGQRYIGSTDVGLSAGGIEEIHDLQHFISEFSFNSIFCSPLKRCRETCELLHLRGNIIIDERIREIHFGRWEKKTFKEIEINDPILVDQWARTESNFGFPDGEQMEDFIKRIADFSKYIKSLDGDRILLITHGGVIRHLICSFLNLNFENYLYFQIKSGRVTVINLHSLGGVMTGLNLGAFHG